MADRAYIVSRTLEDKIAIAENSDQKVLFVTIDVLKEILAVLKEHTEIIRCKDCVNCIKEPNGDLYCDVLAIGYEPLGSKKVTENFFCAEGERKKEI